MDGGFRPKTLRQWPAEALLSRSVADAASSWTCGQGGYMTDVVADVFPIGEWQSPLRRTARAHSMETALKEADAFVKENTVR